MSTHSPGSARDRSSPSRIATPRPRADDGPSSVRLSKGSTEGPSSPTSGTRPAASARASPGVRYGMCGPYSVVPSLVAAAGRVVDGFPRLRRAARPAAPEP